MHEKITILQDKFFDITLQMKIDKDTHANEKDFLYQEINQFRQELTEARTSCLHQTQDHSCQFI